MEISVHFSPKTVFLAGERIQCAIQFRDLRPAPLPSASPPPEGSHPEERQCIAWASVQLQCECIMDQQLKSGGASGMKPSASFASSLVNAATSPRSPPPSTSSNSLSTQPLSEVVDRTSFRPVDWLEGSQMTSSAPKLLFCELWLGAGESRTFEFSDLIPGDAPPSYRGKNVKFCYNLLIGTQRLNAAVKVVKVPVRVLAVDRNPAQFEAVLERLNRPPTKHAKNSPFLSVDENGVNEEEANLVADAINNMTLRRKPVYFDIANSQGKIAKLCLLKTNFKLGEDIIASFDFSKGDIDCAQYSACLVCEEEIFAPPSAAAAEAHQNGGEPAAERKPLRKNRIRHSKFHDFCIGASESSMSLEVPLHITPSFSSQLCRLTYKLQFEFVVSQDKVVPKDAFNGVTNGTGGEEFSKVSIKPLSFATSETPLR